MNRWQGTAVAAVALIALGCSSADKTASDPGAKNLAPATTETGTDTAGATTAAGARDPKPSDFVLAVKKTKNQCFGEAGCLVEYHVVVTIDDAAAINETNEYTVTYEVSGVDDGPATNSFTMQGGKYSAEQGETGNTKKNSTKLTAKVTDVEQTG